MRYLFYGMICCFCFCCFAGCSRKQILKTVQKILHLHPTNIHDPEPEPDQTEGEIVEDIVEDSIDIAEDIIEDII